VLATIATCPLPQAVLTFLITLDDFKLEIKLLAAKDEAQVLLPELSGEAQRTPALIQVNKELKPDGSP
jgi:hypothetical protein